MSYRPLKAQQSNSVLHSSATLQRLMARAQVTDDLQQLLNQCLQPAAREHCHIATYQAGILSLIVTDANWATRLRYQQKRLLKQLQGLTEFSQVLRLQFKVRPPMQPEKAPARSITLSEQAGQTIQASADATQDPALREALQRLAQHAKKS